MELKGKICHISEKRSGISKTGSAWTAQTFVIESGNQYPRRAAFDIFGEEKITQFGTILTAGREVIVFFDINARETDSGHWFNSLNAWKIEAAGEAIAPANDAQVFPKREEKQPAPAPAQAPMKSADLFGGHQKPDNADDLPF